jgi:hypothetical protein
MTHAESLFTDFNDYLINDLDTREVERNQVGFSYETSWPIASFVQNDQGTVFFVSGLHILETSFFLGRNLVFYLDESQT